MATKTKMRITKEVEIRIPNLPNYFLVEKGKGEEVKEDTAVPIQDFPDDELQKVGEAWTEALIELAKKKRKTTK